MSILANNSIKELVMLKNLSFLFVLSVTLFVIFTNTGFEMALSYVGNALDTLIAFANNIH